jgi:hypothetical protein
MEVCLALVIFAIIIIVIVAQDLSNKISSRSSGGSTTLPGIANQNSKVRITGRDDLISWALHKHPEDIDTIDYRNTSVQDADVVIHRDGGVNKVIKGPDKGRILTDREVEEYQRRDRLW